MSTIHLPSSLSTLYPHLNLETLTHELNVFEITDPSAVQAFIAQCAHESAGFSRFTENLNYSVEGLARTWRSRFANPDGTPNATAYACARNPQKIANAVYNGRMGNQPNSNDGWNVTSSLSFLNMPILRYSNEIRSAVLVIHGEKAHSCYFSRDAFADMVKDNPCTDNKELLLIPGAVHTDLYDRKDVIPFDKIEQFLRSYLK